MFKRKYNIPFVPFFFLFIFQTCALRVNIDCDGCKQKVKKLLQKIEGSFLSIYSFHYLQMVSDMEVVSIMHEWCFSISLDISEIGVCK